MNKLKKLEQERQEAQTEIQNQIAESARIASSIIGKWNLYTLSLERTSLEWLKYTHYLRQSDTIIRVTPTGLAISFRVRENWRIVEIGGSFLEGSNRDIAKEVRRALKGILVTQARDELLNAKNDRKDVEAQIRRLQWKLESLDRGTPTERRLANIRAKSSR